MRDNFSKHFRISAADQQQLDPLQWQIKTPPANTRTPVRLLFDEPLDHAMLQRVLRVQHNSGRRIEGRVRVPQGESSWEFTPEEAWRTGTYFIEIATNLEDLCGNSIARPFEVKLQDGQVSQPASHIAVEFIVK